MNTIIRNIALKAGAGEWGHSVIPAMMGIEAFVNLLVQECVSVVESDISDGDACCTNTAYRIGEKIRKHFGGEENHEY